ncbi:MAG: hypothetical protein M1122_02215 [Candidatus Marsarchaeota archaeon]|jgi:small subunit ribosomal protein S24e|nr:hypothetical protein [Candidatus Marsarchaeota archaeon]
MEFEDMKVLKDQENKLIGRREISIFLSYEGKTPSRDEIKEGVCKKLSLDPEITDVVKVDQLYGSMASNVKVYCYKDKKAMDMFVKSEEKSKEKEVSNKK